MSFTHMIILGIIALIVIPPEKLPEVAREIARFISELKNSADQIMGELKRDAIFKPEDILDKNIKEKLAELQKDINKTVNLNSVEVKPAPPMPKPMPAPGAAPSTSAAASTPPASGESTSSDDGSSGSNGGNQS